MEAKNELLDSGGNLQAHAYVVSKLKSMRMTPELLDQLERDTGVSQHTIKKIRWGQIVNPGVSHIEKLANYFRGEEAKAA